MLDFNEYLDNTVQFTVQVIDKQPENYYDAKSWEQGRGAYYVKENDCIYLVGKYSVDTIYSISEKGFFTIVKNTYEAPKVDERLFLKAIAASNGHNL